MILQDAALLLIDLQNDFCPGGALAVPEGDRVIPIANAMMEHFKIIIATQDWHPKNHVSFESLWPVHCVQHSVGAQFHPDLNVSRITKIFRKGVDQHVDSYSAFYDNNHLKSTGLTDWLRSQKIKKLYVMGLATDYCVKYSCLDAIADGFTVVLIQDGCRGVNLHPQDSENAIREMTEKNIKCIRSARDLIV